MAYIKLHGAHNTRDLGGTPTTHGKFVKPNKLIRSGDLSKLTTQDIDLLTKGHNLTTVVDLRNVGEVAKCPDVNIDGVQYIHNPILSAKVLGVSRQDQTQSLIEMMKMSVDTIISNNITATQYMQVLYKQFVLDGYATEQYAKFFDILLAERQGAVLWHCSAGKDRAGTATALLLKVLGANQATIVDNYMETLQYVKPHVEQVTDELRQKGFDQHSIDIARYTLQVEPSYITTVFETIEQQLGGWQQFVSQQLHLDDRKIEQLQLLYTN